MVSTASLALLRAECQDALFGTLDRARLAELPPLPVRTRVRVAVHRNHGVEMVASATRPFASWSGYAIDWSFGAYDDALSFADFVDADVHVLWIDAQRLSGLDAGQAGAFFVGRLHALRALTSRPVIVALWPLHAAERAALEAAAIPGVHVADLAALARELGSSWLDTRTEPISGTRLSNRACLALARELACCWIPAAVLPPLKCVAVDLDDTLHDGILAESGPAGVQLTERKRNLQSALAALRECGILLALVSRNELADIEALFAARPDYPLSLSDFSAVEASWSDKAQALARVARRLHIDTEAIVFLDDNPGELATVSAGTAALTVHAGARDEVTRAALLHAPGIFRFRVSEEDRLRAGDVAASAARATLAAAASPEEYLQSLAMRLVYRAGRDADLGRVASLLHKTNQFNLSLQRMSEAEVARRAEEHPDNVVTVGLSDRLSDSGVVAAVVGHCQGEVLHVDELAVSCRALGRRVEAPMLAEALRLMAGRRRVERVQFAVALGPRNGPAREWLAGIAGRAAAGVVTLPLSAFAAARPNAIQWSVALPELAA